jgi:hypothetical protein
MYRSNTYRFPFSLGLPGLLLGSAVAVQAVPIVALNGALEYDASCTRFVSDRGETYVVLGRTKVTAGPAQLVGRVAPLRRVQCGASLSFQVESVQPTRAGQAVRGGSSAEVIQSPPPLNARGLTVE